MVAASLYLLPFRLAAVSAFLGAAMLAIATIDVDRFIIPDWLSLPAIPAGLLASGTLLDPGAGSLIEPDHIVAAVIAGGGLWGIATIHRRWRGAEGLGAGDIKLACAAGAWVGIELLALVLLLAAGSALAAVQAGSVRRAGNRDRVLRIPFGAFLAPSTWVVWVLMVAGKLG